MSRIDELIKEYCPYGVEYKEIWQLTAWDKKFNEVNKSKQKKVISYPYVLANKFKEIECANGDIRLLSTGNYIGFTTEKLAGRNLCEGEIVAIPWGGKANIKYYKGKFVTSDNRIATSLDTNILSNKFLYYCMLVQNEKIQSFYRGSGVQHPSMKDVLDLKIPVPPIQIQEDIVRILDNFTNLTAELEAELESRKKQYEYYINELLEFGDDVKKDYIRNIGKICMCKRIMKNQTKNSGDIPFYKIGTFGKQADAYISNDIYEEYKSKFSYPKKSSILISASGTIGRTVIFDGEPAYFQDSNIVWIDNDETKVINKFLYYLYQVMEWKIEGGTIKRLYNDNFGKIKIPIPSIAEQERIVTILDKFDKLVNNMTSEGLPAEIEKRKQQYEYYRNKLLTFDEVNNNV